MKGMSSINTIIVSGGTHGNELTGIKLYEKWSAHPEAYARKCPSAKLTLVHTNLEGTRLCRRYADLDLNRSFSAELLALKGDPHNYEISRAQELNALYGPKGPATKTDLIIDVHNTTSNMGFCLILSTRDPFTMRASAELVHEIPDAFIYYQPEERSASPYFGTIAKADICLEIGPQSHGTLRADLFERTEHVVCRYLELAEEWNRGELQRKPKKKVDVYTQYRDLDYPRDAAHNISAMIHPAVQDHDYREVRPGDPMFRSFDGKDLPYEGDRSVWPIFVNEAAYYEKKIAMSLTLKTEEEW